MAFAIIALLSAPSYAQEISGAQQTPGGKKHRGGGQKTEQQTKKPDDRAYNSALSRIPNQKYDPWHDLRK